MWSTFSAPSLREPTTISLWLCRYWRAMRSTSFDIVAEKSSVWRDGGSWSKMALMLSEKPMLSISSASSSTMVLAVEISATPRSVRSTRRPGVATMTWVPLRSWRICESMGAPPYTAVMRSPSIYLPKSRRSSLIWRHSSRVGDMMTACVSRRERSRACRRGSPKAAVLPVPVCARAMMS